MTRRDGTVGAALAAVGAAALWGTTGTAQALGPDEADPVAVGALRIIVGSVVLAVLAVRRVAPSGGAVLPGRLPAGLVVLLGGLCVAAYQGFFFVGVSRAGVAVGTVVALGVAPVATGLLATLLGERPDRVWAWATAGALAGVVLLVLGTGSAGTAADLPGLLAAAGAGVAYAGYTVAARTLLLRGARGTAVMAGFFTVGAVLLAPTLLLTDLAWLTGGPGLLMVLWLGTVATGLSYVLFQHGLSHLSARTVATLSLAEPVTATLLGVLVLDEVLPPLSAAGAGLVVLSLLLMAVPGRRPVTPAVG